MTETVAFFNGYYLPHLGGVERYTHNIAQKLIERGYRVIIVTSRHAAELANVEEVNGVKVYRLPISNVWHERYPFLLKNKLYHKLMAELQQESIDYYVANTRFHIPALLGTKLAAERGKEAIVIEHGSSYLTLNNPLLDVGLRFVERSLIRGVKKRTKRFYGVSKEAAAWLQEFNINSEGVLYNAIDINDFTKFTPVKDEDKVRIIYSGRLIPKMKGVETLLAAFDRISKEFSNVELTIAGDGPLLEWAKDNYDSPKINFLGFVNYDEVMRQNAKSDIFVLMSRSEGFSTAMLEAALLENVIVTTPTVGGVHDVIKTEDDGYIIDNDEDQLYAVLRELVLDKQKLRNMQHNVSQIVKENFTWERTAEAFIKAFK